MNQNTRKNFNAARTNVGFTCTGVRHGVIMDI